VTVVVPVRRALPQEVRLRELERRLAMIEQAGVRVGDLVSLTGQVANISSTKIITGARNGMYRVQVVAQCTTSAAVPALTITIGWTDRVGAATSSFTRALNSTGQSQLLTVMQVQPDTDITYATSGFSGSPVYALEVRLDRIAE